jgi:hypothetical protein
MIRSSFGFFRHVDEDAAPCAHRRGETLGPAKLRMTFYGPFATTVVKAGGSPVGLPSPMEDEGPRPTATRFLRSASVARQAAATVARGLAARDLLRFERVPMAVVLPPTRPDLTEPSTRPYFLWWTDATVGDLRRHLASPDQEERAYWTGALLREANTRDVWLYLTAADVRAQWPRLVRYLGRSRDRWAFLLGFDPPLWPPEGARAE